jgi:hypothetical protein
VTNDRDDLLHVAWAIIANTGGGDWSNQTEEWRNAATRWRNLFHARHKS